jgi:hypothetical protein
MNDLDLYVFLVVTLGHFALIPLWLRRFAGGEFPSLEAYLFFASFFSVGSFYVVLHFIGLLGGISLWKGVIGLAMLHFCLWQPFFKITFFKRIGDQSPFSIGWLGTIVFILTAAIVGQWIYLAYQKDIVAGIDALHYHVPHMVNFANGEPLLGLIPTPHLYPMAHSLLGAWFLLGVHSPLLIDWLNIPAFILIVSSFSFLFSLLTHRSGFSWALLVAFILFSSPLLNAVENVSSDLSHASSYLVLFTILASVAAKKSIFRLEWVGLSLSLGMVIGTKMAGLPLTLTTLFIFSLLKLMGVFKFEVSKPEKKYLLLYLFLFVFAGGIWLFRNWYLFGSPIAPLGFSVLGIRIFEGVDLSHFKYYLSIVKDMRDIPDYQFFHHLYATVQKWYGRYYIFLFAFSGVLFFDTFLLRSHYGRTVVNPPETLREKYGLLLLFISTSMIQGRLLMGAPWSSLNFANGSNIRFMLPLILCSFPLFFSFIIPGKTGQCEYKYTPWIAMAFLLLINLYFYFTAPYNSSGFVQYPSVFWICTTASLFLILKFLHSLTYLNTTIVKMTTFFLLSAILYYGIQEKSSNALQKSELDLIHDLREYKLTGKINKKFFAYKEILLKIKELEKQNNILCNQKRFFLLTRFDFTLCLQGPRYDNSVADIHTPHLIKSAVRVGLRFEPDKYCEFIIATRNPGRKSLNGSTTVDQIRNQITNFMPKGGYIIPKFCTKGYNIYQVVSKP